MPAFRKLRWKILVVGTSVLLLTIILMVQGREPEFKGKSYSYWVEVLGQPAPSGDRKRAEAEQAIQAVGANGARYLVKWVDYEPDGWERKLQKPAYRIFGSSNRLQRRINRKSDLANGALHAFKILGPNGQVAIPRLEAMAFRSQSIPANRAGACLAFIGEPAIPTYISLATNTSVKDRLAFLSSAQHFGTNLWRVLPALAQYRENPNLQIAVNLVLRVANKTSAEFMPGLLKNLHSSDTPIRLAAEGTLRELSTNALAAVEVCLRHQDPEVAQAAREVWERKNER